MTEKPCNHDWELGGKWGVIIGLSKCKKCGKTAAAADFLAIAETKS